jgi:bifunctional DNA-binding transcriptional regulator/antitoxin component of YhaV-PrlF toxin-antitoxin module
MTVTVKNKNGLVVPPTVQRKAGIKVGDELEFRVSGGIINIIPKVPSADSEYTPQQRRVIDAELKAGLAELKAGKTAGPFESADQMISHMKSHFRKKSAAKKLKPSR